MRHAGTRMSSLCRNPVRSGRRKSNNGSEAKAVNQSRLIGVRIRSRALEASREAGTH